MDPYPTRLPQLGDFSSVGGVARSAPVDSGGRFDAPPWLTVIRFPALPIEPLPLIRRVNLLLWGRFNSTFDPYLQDDLGVIVVGKPSLMAYTCLERYPRARSVYDAMDHFSAFYQGLSSLSMAYFESIVIRRVDRVLVSSTGLYEYVSKLLMGDDSKVVLAKNACDPNAMPGVSDLIGSQCKVVLGYVGTIGAWFDWDVIRKIANSCPECVVRLIGPLSNRPSFDLPANVELLPACSHDQAIKHMNSFSVGLIPFLKNVLTESVDPIKYYEYISMGLGVVSTAFGEMSNRSFEPGVFLLSEDASVNKVVDAASAWRPDDNWLNEFRKKNSWDGRFSAASAECGGIFKEDNTF